MSSHELPIVVVSVGAALARGANFPSNRSGAIFKCGLVPRRGVEKEKRDKWTELLFWYSVFRDRKGRWFPPVAEELAPRGLNNSRRLCASFLNIFESLNDRCCFGSLTSRNFLLEVRYRQILSSEWQWRNRKMGIKCLDVIFRRDFSSRPFDCFSSPEATLSRVCPPRRRDPSFYFLGLRWILLW